MQSGKRRPSWAATVAVGALALLAAGAACARSSARVSPEDAGVAARLGAVASAVPESPATPSSTASLAGGATVSPAASATASHAAALGAGAPPDAGARFSADDWLRDHGGLHLPQDAACGAKGYNDCTCNGTLQLAGVGELLVCERPRDSKGPSVAAVVHTVLYALRGGTLRAVLDVPTYAACSWEYASMRMVPAWLRAVADGAELVIEDRDTPCELALEAAVREQQLLDRAVLATVCASRGRYAWKSGRLVKATSR